MAVEDAGSIELILQKIRHIIPALNDNSALGLPNAQALRCLIILYVANIDPKFEYMGKIDEDDKLRYFTIGELKKVRKREMSIRSNLPVREPQNHIRNVKKMAM